MSSSPSLLAVLLVLLSVSMESASGASAQCRGKPVDLVFVLDSSSSIWPGHYNLSILPFLKEVVAAFEVGAQPWQTRVGVLTFSDGVQLQFQLGQHLTQPSLLAAIDGLVFQRGNTNTAAAIAFAASEMFSPWQGARPSASHVMVVLTDGRSNEPSKTASAASLARQAGVKVFAIGVGRSADFNELAAIASQPTADFVYRVSAFSALSSIKDLLSKKTCEALEVVAPLGLVESTTETTTTTTKPTTTTLKPTTTTTTTTTPKPTTTTTTPKPTTTTTTPEPTTTTTTPKPTTTTTTPEPTTTTTTPKPTTTPAGSTSTSGLDGQPQGDSGNVEGCTGKPAELFFVLDSSSSVYIKHFQEQVLGFVAAVVSQLDVAPSRTRVGLVTFSDSHVAEFGLATHSSRQEVLAAVHPDHVTYLSGGTNTAGALRYVREKGLAPGVARPGVQRLVVVLTDGMSQRTWETEREAARLHAEGVAVFAVGVGPSTDKQELQQIASDPDERFLYSVEDFHSLAAIQNGLALALCSLDPATSLQKDASATCKMAPSDVTVIQDAWGRSAGQRQLLVTALTRMSVSVSLARLPLRLALAPQPCPPSRGAAPLSPQVFRREVTLLAQEASSLHAMLTSHVTSLRAARAGGDRRQLTLVLVEAAGDMATVARQAGEVRQAGGQAVVVTLGRLTWEARRALTATSVLLEVDSLTSLPAASGKMLAALCRAAEDAVVPLPELSPK